MAASLGRGQAVLAGAALAALGASAFAPRASTTAEVPYVRIDGPITAVSADYADRALAAAEAAGSPAFLIELDTPGGDSNSVLELTGRLLNAGVPTIVWVGPQGAQAASAGTFVVLAAHAAGMARRTTMGAASPVGSGGEDLPETLGRKATEDFATTARGLAARRGEKAADWAERAVRAAESVSAEGALDLGLIDAVADDPEALLAELDGLEVVVGGQKQTLEVAGSPLEEVPMNAAEGLLGFLAHPAVALILLTIGLNGILIELSHPGGFLAGTAGVLALLLGFYSLGVLDANLIGLAFMAAAFVLFFLDVKAPTHGLLSAGGIGLFILGAVILFSGHYYDVPWVTIGVLAVGSAIFFTFVVAAARRAMRRPTKTGAEGLVGAHAEVRKALEPRGKVLLAGELWDARAESSAPLAVGSAVEVVAREGYTLVVRPVAAGPPATSVAT